MSTDEDENIEKCPTCDGSGEVHSHNPRCWDCNGRGTVTKEKAERLQEKEKRLLESGFYRNFTRGVPPW